MQFGVHKAGYFGERPKFEKSTNFGCGMFLPVWHDGGAAAAPTVVAKAGVKSIAGFVCNSAAQLTAACEALGAKQFVVRHTYPLSLNQHMLILNDPSELALYPPPTDVLMAVHAVHATMGATQGDYRSYMVVIEEEDITSVLSVWHSSYREVEWKPFAEADGTNASALRAELARAATAIVGTLEMRTCGVLEFVVEADATAGAPPTVTLVDARMGCFAPINAYIKMVRTSVPANRTWRLLAPRPPTRVTAWMLWNRLKQKKVVFTPGESKKGEWWVCFLLSHYHMT